MILAATVKQKTINKGTMMMFRARSKAFHRSCNSAAETSSFRTRSAERYS